jgi:hypothetical protein
MSQHRPTIVSGFCKRDAEWNSSAVLARQDEVETFGAGQAITKVIGSSEEGTVDSVLIRLRLDIIFLFSKGGGMVAFVVDYGNRKVCIA